MKGLILAGGDGTRLQPITHSTQKQLIPVANQPVIDLLIRNLKAAGITEIGIVVGGDFPEAVQDHLGDGRRFDVDITYIYQGKPLGLAHAVACAEDFVKDEPFVVCFGDTVIGRKLISDLISSFNPETYDAGLVLQRVDEPSRFGIIDLNGNDEIVGILEKPDDPPTNLAYIGILALTAKIFEAIEKLEFSWRGELELTHALHELVIDGNPVDWQIGQGLWKDVGTPEDVLDTNRLLLDELEQNIEGEIDENATVTGPIKLGRGSAIEPGATVLGPVSIGKDAVIGSRSYIGPYTSIGHHSVIQNVHIESSVIMDDVTINGGRRIDNSIIAEGVSITSTDGETEGKRFVIGRGATIKD